MPSINRSDVTAYGSNKERKMHLNRHMLDQTSAQSILILTNNVFYFAVTALLLSRYFDQLEELPIYDSISVNPYLFFLLGVSLGGRFFYRYGQFTNKKLSILVDLYFFAGFIVYTIAHFSNVFHYIDPVHRV